MRLITFIAALIACSPFAHAGDRTNQQKSIQDSWYQCIRVYALTVAAETSEPASLIAKAALTACEDEGNKLFRHFSSGPEPMRSFALEELFPAIQNHNQEKVLAEILAQRASQ